MAQTPIIIGTGPIFRFELQKPGSCDPLDLTDYSVHFFLKRSLQDSDIAAEFHGALSDGIEFAFGPTDGVVDVKIPVEATSNLRAGRPYPYYLQIYPTAETGLISVPFRGEVLPALSSHD